MDQRKAWVAGLRELASWVETHPDLPLPARYGETFNIFVTHEGSDPKETMARAARHLGGFVKESNGDWLNLVRRFGPHAISVSAQHSEVCERVVVGTGLITRKVTREVREQGEIVEWRCPESILKAASHAAA